MAGRKPGSQKTGGRQKGTPNKVTKAVKDVIAGAAEALGGQKRLVAWAKKDAANERIFWGQIYPKLLPLTVGGDPENPLHLVTRVTLEAMDDHSTDPAT